MLKKYCHKIDNLVFNLDNIESSSTWLAVIGKSFLKTSTSTSTITIYSLLLQCLYLSITTLEFRHNRSNLSNGAKWQRLATLFELKYPSRRSFKAAGNFNANHFDWFDKEKENESSAFCRSGRMCRTNVYLLQQRQRARSHSGHFFLITKLFEQKKCSRSSACWPSRPSSGSRSSWLCSEETSSNGQHEFEQSGKVQAVLLSVSYIFTN